MYKKNKKKSPSKKLDNSRFPPAVTLPEATNKPSLLLSVLYAVIVVGVCLIVSLLCITLANNSNNKIKDNKNDNPVFLPITENSEIIPYPETSVTAPESSQKIPSAETDAEPSESDTVQNKGQVLISDIKNILQLPGLPNGCEVTSLAIALNYYGYDIDPITLYYDFMPSTGYQDGDPWTTYVGDATGWGLGCYAPCVVKTGNDYINSVFGSHLVRDVSYKKLSDYEKYIDEGTPVILWGMLDMEWSPDLAWAARIDGKNVTWYSRSHCLVLIGYTEDDYIFCDPLQGIMYYDKYKVLDCFTALFKQACIIQEYDPALDESYTEEVFDETVEDKNEEEPDLWYNDDWLYDDNLNDEEYFESEEETVEDML